MNRGAKVTVLGKEQDREIVLLKNHLEFGATTISAIYKDGIGQHQLKMAT